MNTPKFDSKEYKKERVPCGCGIVYSRSNKKHHEATKRHTEWVSMGRPNREVVEAVAVVETPHVDNRVNAPYDISRNISQFGLLGKWQSFIVINDVPKHLGFFDTEEEAKNAFRRFVIDHHLEIFYRL